MCSGEESIQTLDSLPLTALLAPLSKGLGYKQLLDGTMLLFIEGEEMCAPEKRESQVLIVFSSPSFLPSRPVPHPIPEALSTTRRFLTVQCSYLLVGKVCATEEKNILPLNGFLLTFRSVPHLLPKALGVTYFLKHNAIFC